MNLTNATEVLLAALRCGDEHARAQRLGRIAPEDWPDILRLAHQHNVTALLHYKLKALGIRVPEGELQQLRSEAASVAAQNLRRFHHLRVVLHSFQQNGIAVIPLKGVYLAEVVYGSIGLRSMSDVDLLVSKQDLSRAQDVMHALGFTRSSPTSECYGQLGFKHPKIGYYEVHWGVTYKRGLSIDTEALWQRAREALVAGVPVRELSPEDQVLHLCIHASGHYFSFGLRAICDIAETLRHHQHALDWKCLSRRASSWGVARVLLVNLWLAKELLNAPGVDQWLGSMQSHCAELPHLNLARQCVFESAQASDRSYCQSLPQIWAERSLRGKLRLLWQGITNFSSRGQMANEYPAPPDSLRIYVYYPVHLAYLLPRLVRGTWYLVSSKACVVSRVRFENYTTVLREWMWTRD